MNVNLPYVDIVSIISTILNRRRFSFPLSTGKAFQHRADNCRSGEVTGVPVAGAERPESRSSYAKKLLICKHLTEICEPVRRIRAY